jgi:hypothetical protein
VNLKIRGGVDFVTNLIVLESNDIDVILGMDQLSKHKVLIDWAKKSDYSRRKGIGVCRITGSHCQECCQSCEVEPTGC